MNADIFGTAIKGCLARIINAAAIGAFACLVIGFGVIAWQSSIHPHHKQETSAKRQNSYKKTENIIPPEDANDRIARYTLWLAILTAGLVGTAVFQGWFLIRADKATMQTLVLSQRPRLRVRNVAIIPADPKLGVIQVDQFIEGELIVVNIGGNAAKITDSHCVVFWTPGQLPMRRPFEGKEGNKKIPLIRLLPGESVRSTFRSDQPIGREGIKVSDHSAGHWELFIMGWIEYRDDAGIVRRAGFCRQYMRELGDWTGGRIQPVTNPDYEHED